jgi:hypothetical protein
MAYWNYFEKQWSCLSSNAYVCTYVPRWQMDVKYGASFLCRVSKKRAVWPDTFWKSDQNVDKITQWWIPLWLFSNRFFWKIKFQNAFLPRIIFFPNGEILSLLVTLAMALLVKKVLDWTFSISSCWNSNLRCSTRTERCLPSQQLSNVPPSRVSCVAKITSW